MFLSCECHRLGRKKKTRSRGNSRRRAFADCWQYAHDRDTEKLKRIVSSDESSFKHLLRFVDENNLAVITWQSFGGYLIGTSSDEMTEKQSKDYDFMFNDRLSEWGNGYRRVLHKFTLPKNSAMICGFSGGGQIAHRAALRKPQYFSGIHIHVNSSYNKPTPNAKNIVWLVTTGELEYGYPAATRFYQNMIDLGYAVIFKAGENLGHSTNAQINNFSPEFFKYMINFVPDPSNPDWKTPPGRSKRKRICSQKKGRTSKKRNATLSVAVQAGIEPATK